MYDFNPFDIIGPYIFWVAIINLAFSALPAFVATQKNRSGASWFWIAFFASPLLALVALAAVPAKTELIRSQLNESLALLDGAEVGRCSRCGEWVPLDANNCKTCGHLVAPEFKKFKTEAQLASAERAEKLAALRQQELVEKAQRDEERAKRNEAFKKRAVTWLKAHFVSIAIALTAVIVLCAVIISFVVGMRDAEIRSKFSSYKSVNEASEALHDLLSDCKIPKVKDLLSLEAYIINGDRVLYAPEISVTGNVSEPDPWYIATRTVAGTGLVTLKLNSNVGDAKANCLASKTTGVNFSALSEGETQDLPFGHSMHFDAQGYTMTVKVAQ